MLKTMPLHDLQKLFMDSVRRPETGDAALASLICEKPPISQSIRFEIYRDGYANGMVTAMGEDFPRVREEVGDAKFERLALEYLQAMPSHYASLAEIGRDFPHFLFAKESDYWRKTALLAQDDWLESRVSYTADIPESALTAEQLERALASPDTSGVFVQRAPSVCFSRVGTRLQIAHRRNNEVRIEAGSEGEVGFLERLDRPVSLDGMATLAQEMGVSPNDLQTWVSRWLRDEIIYCGKA